eukprot:NODE_1235_length_942_cov_104.018405_g1189_i0.p1 GENE.NODE_1235_length_942_cov_104.018405_g1189_i0~~NODE_1235_length_942_cov_104.018405_g1189_i0.p1  ORF type:complete len:204 (-),score=38.34 NODE_1235_length_942_cov_104.018405_g1189_i0:52-663(-)
MNPATELLPGDLDPASQAGVITVTSRASHHQFATAPMGDTQDGVTVVDNTFKVFGTANLRVVDASVIPSPQFSNPMATIAALGSLASTFLAATDYSVDVPPYCDVNGFSLAFLSGSYTESEAEEKCSLMGMKLANVDTSSCRADELAVLLQAGNNGCWTSGAFNTAHLSGCRTLDFSTGTAQVSSGCNAQSALCVGQVPNLHV